MPEAVRNRIGRALFVAQLGARPRDATPLVGFRGATVLEIRDDYETDTYRCVFTVRFAEVLYVLHAFQKKSKAGIKTPKAEVDLIRKRLVQAEDHYRQQSYE